jgi:hypothetical protein
MSHQDFVSDTLYEDDASDVVGFIEYLARQYFDTVVEGKKEPTLMLVQYVQVCPQSAQNLPCQYAQRHPCVDLCRCKQLLRKLGLIQLQAVFNLDLARPHRVNYCREWARKPKLLCLLFCKRRTVC